VALTLPLVVGVLQAQTPKFDVASIRPCQAGQGPAGFRPAPGMFRAVCLAAQTLVGTAYMNYGDPVAGTIFARDNAISGGPAWFNSDQYDVEAKAEGNPAASIMAGPMLRALKLKLHRETREIPVYELTIAKAGFKLKPLPEGSCTQIEPLTPAPKGLTDAETQAYFAHRCNAMGYQPDGLNLHAATLDQFAGNLSHLIAMDRPVVNKTGIAGIFDFHLVFVPGDNMPTASFGGNSPAEATGKASTGSSIFTAMQEQLGLKLTPAKAPGTFLVIDRVEKPSGN
jgi:uncharacterized protein (TIGR03435 family)